MDENKIQKAWEEYHGPIDDGWGESYRTGGQQ